jgi:hypothetical protein
MLSGIDKGEQMKTIIRRRDQIARHARHHLRIPRVRVAQADDQQ